MFKFKFFSIKQRLLTAAVLVPIIMVAYLSSVAIGALSTQSFLAKLRSPVQIDRTPVMEEKVIGAIKDIENLMAGEEPDVKTAYVDLLKSKNQSKLLKSFKTQVMTWIDQKKAGQTDFQYPLSVKQTAWMVFLLYPGKFENPKLNKELYPDEKS